MIQPDAVDQNRLRELKREAKRQGLGLDLQRTPKNHRPYYAVVRSHTRGAELTLLFSLGEVATFLNADPTLRESTDRTSHLAREDAQIEDLRTGQIIQQAPYPIPSDDRDEQDDL